MGSSPCLPHGRRRRWSRQPSPLPLDRLRSNCGGVPRGDRGSARLDGSAVRCYNPNTGMSGFDERLHLHCVASAQHHLGSEQAIRLARNTLYPSAPENHHARRNRRTGNWLRSGRGRLGDRAGVGARAGPMVRERVSRVPCTRVEPAQCAGQGLACMFLQRWPLRGVAALSRVVLMSRVPCPKR